MKISGKIISSETGKPIPSASIIVVDKLLSTTGVGTTADAQGNFYLNDSRVSYPNSLTLSSIGYNSLTTRLDDMDYSGLVFQLEPYVYELPPVIVHGSTKKSNNAWLLLLAIPLLVKKKAVGKIEPMPILLLAGGAFVLFKGMDIVNKILEALGLQSSQDENDVQDEIENPNSPWNKNYWEKGPVGTLLLNNATATKMIADLGMCFGPWGDDEDKAAGIIKQVKTKSQLSYLSYRFAIETGLDFLTWLRGDEFPDDRLSSGEINELNKYIEKLPAYKP